MSHTDKDIKRKYLTEYELRSYFRSCRCDSWCIPEKRRSRKSENKLALQLEMESN